VFVVWFNVLVGDSKVFVDLKLLNDRRVTNFWDDNKLTGKWFSQHVENAKGGTVWDAYFLYGAEAHWNQHPGPLVGSGNPVIGSIDQLQQSIDALIRA
jgi:hypothetical protein